MTHDEQLAAIRRFKEERLHYHLTPDLWQELLAQLGLQYEHKERVHVIPANLQWVYDELMLT